MKRLLILILVFLSVSLLAQTSKTVTVVEVDHAPFAYTDSRTQKIKGAEITYMIAILKDLGYQPSFLMVPFARMTKMLQTGEADMGALLSKTAEREVFAYFSSKPVLIMNPIIVVRKDNPLMKLKSPADLKGMQIGFTANLAMPDFFKDSSFLTFDLTTGKYDTEQNIKKLLAKHIDAFIEVNPFSFKFITKNNSDRDSIRILNVPGQGAMYYFIISQKSKFAADILKGINTIMSKKKYDFEKFLKEEMK